MNYIEIAFSWYWKVERLWIVGRVHELLYCMGRRYLVFHRIAALFCHKFWWTAEQAGAGKHPPPPPGGTHSPASEWVGRSQFKEFWRLEKKPVPPTPPNPSSMNSIVSIESSVHIFVHKTEMAGIGVTDQVQWSVLSLSQSSVFTDEKAEIPVCEWQKSENVKPFNYQEENTFPSS